ncbi:MAG: NADP-dependent oxidoreductase [Pseudomonadota bacterium]
MKAVYYEEFGDAGVLKVGERPVPDPAPNEVLIQVGAVSVNPIDRRLRSGELQEFFQREWPITPGWDVAGRIAKVGADVKDWKVGDEVLALAFNWKLGAGTYAEYAPVEADHITAKPAHLSYVEAACIPLVSLTAWQSLDEYAQTQSGQTVFIQAGAGGLGGVAIQMAKHLGARVYTTCRAANADYVKSLGADVAIDYSTADYFKVLKELEPEGVDVVLELLLNDIVIENAIHLAKPGGVVVYMNNEPPEMPEVAQKGLKTQFFHHRADGEMLTKLVKFYTDGIVKLPEIEVMPLEEAAKAHRRSESGRTRGKIALKVADL